MVLHTILKTMFIRFGNYSLKKFDYLINTKYKIKSTQNIRFNFNILSVFYYLKISYFLYFKTILPLK